MKRMFDWMQQVVTVFIICWGGILLPIVATLAWLNHGWPTTTRYWLVAGVAASLTLFAWAVAFREWHRWSDADRLFWRSAKFIASLFTGWGDAIRELKARGWYHPGPEPRHSCVECDRPVSYSRTVCSTRCESAYFGYNNYNICRTVGCNAHVAVDPLGIDCILHCEECWQRATEVARDASAAAWDAKEHGLFGVAAFHEKRLAEAQAVIEACGDRHWSPICEQCGWRSGNPDRCQHCSHEQ